MSMMLVGAHGGDGRRKGCGVSSMNRDRGQGFASEPSRTMQGFFGPKYLRRVLAPTDIPPPGASWDKIGPLAISFDASAYWSPSGDVWATADHLWKAVAEGSENEVSPIELRTALFSAARYFGHNELDVEGGRLAPIQAVVEAIRRNVQAGTADPQQSVELGQVNESFRANIIR